MNKAEKINAYRGEFKNTFREIRETHKLFNYFGKEKRFRFRQLAAELLLLELEGDFNNKIFPPLDLKTLIFGIKKYEKKISKNKLRFFNGNLDYIVESLNMLLGAFKMRDIISFYLLISYLRHKRAGNQNLKNELAAFAKDFMQKLNLFSIYDTKPPKEMNRKEFLLYKSYKHESKIMTTANSFRNRLDIMLKEFEKQNPIIIRDKKRLHDIEQKRMLYFRQKGMCTECNKSLDFTRAEAHHEIAHSAGGKTDDLSHSQLVHSRCHKRLEKRLKKIKLLQ
ncbi:MAG: HNH endonuclease [Candidatus Cloacimonetes bacterium]|nr:HNH endonuclease [Candidatus Cloacimonadota bacterium]